MLLRKFKKAQGATEYAIFIAAVLAGLLALQVYYSRSVKGNMKGRADSIGEQFDNKGGEYVRESRSASAATSYSNVGESEMDDKHKQYADRQSVNVMADGTKSSTIKGDGKWLNVFGSTAATAKHTSGAVSSSEYVNEFTVDGDKNHVASFGSHGYADMGAIEGNGESVFSDGLYNTKADCEKYISKGIETQDSCNAYFP